MSVRGVALILMALVLGACARDAYVVSANMKTVGNWKHDTVTDRITGKTSSSAQLLTQASSTSGEDFPAPAALQLTCFEAKPIVRFAFDFKIGSDRDAIMGYRFDEKPGHDNANSRITFGNTDIVIEDPAEVWRFVSELRTSEKLVIRLRSITSGRTVADFQRDGASAAIEAGFAGCTVVKPPPEPAKKPRRRV